MFNFKKYSWLWVLLAIFAASVEPILVKIGYQGSVTPLQLLTYRNLVAALVAILCFPVWTWIGWRNALKVASVSTLLLLTNGSILYALTHLTAVTIITAVKTTPALVAIVNQWRGRDQLSAKFWVGFVMAFAGMALTIGGFSESLQAFHPWAVVALLVAIGSSTIYRTRLETLTATIEPRTVSFYIFIVNALLVSVLFLPWLDPLPKEAIPISLWIGIAAALANVAFVAAVYLLGSTRMSMFDMIQRPVVIVIAAVILGEPLGWVQVLGIVMVLWGVHLAKVKRLQKPAASPAEPPLAVATAGGQR